MYTQYNTITVHMSGNAFYPKVTITRGSYSRQYWVSSVHDLKRIQYLFDIHSHLGGKIYVNLENSTVELTKSKLVKEG